MRLALGAGRAPADAAAAGRKRDPRRARRRVRSCCWRAGRRSCSWCSCRRDARRSRWISRPISGSWRSPRRSRSLTGLLFGLAPAWRATRIDLSPALKNVRSSLTRSLRPGRSWRSRSSRCRCCCWSPPALFVRSLQKLNGKDGAWPARASSMLRVEPKGSDQRGIPGTTERLDRTYRELIRRAQEIPGVRLASMANGTPTVPTSSAGAADPAAVGRAGARADADGLPELLRHDRACRSSSGRDFGQPAISPRRASRLHRQRVVRPPGVSRRESDRQAVLHGPPGAAARARSPTLPPPPEAFPDRRRRQGLALQQSPR